VDLRDVKMIVELARKAGFTELEVETDGLKVRIKKPLGAEDTERTEATQEELPGLTVPIVSRHVGVFHRGEEPGGAPLVEKGDLVRSGQRVGTIQSLNVLSEVTAEVSGIVDHIPVDDGQPVEYGQTLMVLQRTSGAEDEGEES